MTPNSNSNLQEKTVLAMITKIYYKKIISLTKSINENLVVEVFKTIEIGLKYSGEASKVTYTIEFDVIKDKDGNWRLTSLDNETIKKIQGMY